MSTHVLPWHPAASVIEAIDAVTIALRAPTGTRQDDREIAFDFAPDLSPTEADTLSVTVASVVGVTRARGVSLTVAEYQALEAHLATLRTFQQLSRSEFMALTATERDRQAFDVMTALLRVIRTLLRD